MPHPRPAFGFEDKLTPRELAQLARNLLRERAKHDPTLAARLRERGIEADGFDRS